MVWRLRVLNSYLHVGCLGSGWVRLDGKWIRALQLCRWVLGLGFLGCLDQYLCRHTLCKCM
jgi:hypothetical protein